MSDTAIPHESVVTTGPTGPLGRADRRAAILAGAAQAFAAQGYATTSMEEIAAASGITKIIVYRHFDSKEALYRAVLEDVHARLAEEFRIQWSDAPGGIARSMLRVARDRPDAVRLLWRQSVREPEFAEYANELRERAVDVSRTLLAEYVDPAMFEWAAHTCVGWLVESVLAWLDYGDPDRDEQFVSDATAALRGAVGAWVSARSPAV